MKIQLSDRKELLELPMETPMPFLEVGEKSYNYVARLESEDGFEVFIYRLVEKEFAD